MSSVLNEDGHHGIVYVLHTEDQLGGDLWWQLGAELKKESRLGQRIPPGRHRRSTGPACRC
jgi:hypothetical protein